MLKYKLLITDNNKFNIVDNNNNIIKADIHIMEISDYIFNGTVEISSEQYTKINEMLFNDWR